MKDDLSNHRLLDDVLEQAAPEEFRAGALRGMLEEVQHCKHRRRRNVRLATAACLVAALTVLARFLLPSPQHTPANRNELIVHSQPLAPSMILTTRSGIAGTVSSSDFAVAVIENARPQDLFESISDDRLFALLEGRPAALIRHGTTQAELILLNSADRFGFEVH